VRSRYVMLSVHFAILGINVCPEISMHLSQQAPHVETTLNQRLILSVDVDSASIQRTFNIVFQLALAAPFVVEIKITRVLDSECQVRSARADLQCR
jgi:hypothetical protein